MLATFLLLVSGLIIIFLEFYLPGGILGILGGFFLFFSLIAFAMYSDSIIYTILYFLFLTLILFLLVKFVLKNIRYGRFGRKFYSDQDQEGFVASSWDVSFIGKEAIVSTDLRPGGHVVVEGKKYLAISQSGYINKGERVIVVDGEGDSLIVKRLTTQINKE